MFTNCSFFIYKIGELLWDKRTGLLAVSLVLCSIVFLRKGIEIRHDVFNMAFNTIGAYYALRYLGEGRYSYVLNSGIFFGIAIASTQKAIIWPVGIIVGISLYLVRGKFYEKLLKVYCIYFVIIPIPVVLSICYLMAASNESLYSFFKHAVVEVIFAYAPITDELFPFPYNRYERFDRLIFQNPLFYAVGIGAIFSLIALWLKKNTKKIVVTVWAIIGILFFITAKRPFDQSLLPTIPSLAILASGFLTDGFKEFKNAAGYKKIGFGVTFISLLFIWPQCFVSVQFKNKMTRQMENISFCLYHLKSNEKVLCFTQNQIFFDPVLKTTDEECGGRFYDYDAICFEQKMISQQCKVIINDYRTKLLNKEIKKKIRENYLSIQVGDILIPGFKIAPKKILEKRVWIEGYYYSPTLSLNIDGEKISSHLIKLKQKRYRFSNTSSNALFLLYIFGNEGSVKEYLRKM